MNDSMTDITELYGCERCFPEDAEQAATCWYKAATIAELVAESHFSIKIRRCAECRQQFITVFAELIDWDNGEDPQECSVVPINDLEAARLLKIGGERALHEMLWALAPTRRSLHIRWPSGDRKSARWATGVIIGRHD